MHVNIGCLDADRALIFGGPYSNLAAYCGEPVETVDLIRSWDIPVVMGNCEESLSLEAPDFFLLALSQLQYFYQMMRADT